MNPYDPPQHSSRATRPSSASTPGRPCPFCGSANTVKDQLAHQRPNIIYFLLFGWLFLLIRGAFSLRTDLCRDCGEVNRYKSTGSRIAMAVLILMVLLIVLSFLSETDQ